MSSAIIHISLSYTNSGTAIPWVNMYLQGNILSHCQESFYLNVSSIPIEWRQISVLLIALLCYIRTEDGRRLYNLAVPGGSRCHKQNVRTGSSFSIL